MKLTANLIITPKTRENSGTFVFPIPSSTVFIKVKKHIKIIPGDMRKSRGAAKFALESSKSNDNILYGHAKNKIDTGTDINITILIASDKFLESNSGAFFNFETIGKKTVHTGAITVATRFNNGITKVV